MKKNKIIEFPKVTNDYEEDFDDWEVNDYFQEKEDWEGLVEYREEDARLRPDDVYAQWKLGDAYVLNGEYEKAIDFLSNIHRKHPDFGDVQYSILDALFALNKTEDDFNWIKKPIVTRLNKGVLDFCYDFLKNKRKPRSIYDLLSELLIGYGYLKFEDKDLSDALFEDNRFELKVNSSFIHDVEIRVVRKRKGRK